MENKNTIFLILCSPKFEKNIINGCKLPNQHNNHKAQREKLMKK